MSDVFDIQKIREGHSALLKLYGRQGYIDFVASPEIRVYNAHRRLALLLQVQKGKQFHLVSVEVVGLDQKIVDGVLKTKL